MATDPFADLTFSTQGAPEADPFADLSFEQQSSTTGDPFSDLQFAPQPSEVEEADPFAGLQFGDSQPLQAPTSAFTAPKPGKDIKGTPGPSRPIEGIVEAVRQVPERFRIGREQWEADQDLASAVVRNDPEALASGLEESRIRAQEAANLPVADNFWEKAVTGAAQMSAGIFKGSVVPRAKLATGGGLAGLLVGQPLKGAAVGAKVGSVESARQWWNQGVAEFYREMTDEGLSHDEARVAAMIGAAPYAGIELLQFKGLLPKSIQPTMFKEAWKETIKKGTGAIIRRGGLEYLSTVAEESGEEGLQELVKGLTTRFAQDMSDEFAISGKEKTAFKDIVKRSIDATIESIPAMTLLGLGGSTTDAGVALNRRAKSTNVKQQLGNLGEIFGADNVRQIDENTIEATTGSGRPVRMVFKEDLLDEVKRSPAEFLDSIRAQGKQARNDVRQALKDAEGDLNEAVEQLSDVYLPAGDTVVDTEIQSQDGTATTVGDIISLEAGWSTRGQAAHEVFHVLKNLADLTQEEELELQRVVGRTEEQQAYAFEKYADQNPVLRKIKAAGDFILRGFKRNAETDEAVANNIRNTMIDQIREEGAVEQEHAELSDIEKERIDFQFEALEERALPAAQEPLQLTEGEQQAAPEAVAEQVAPELEFTEQETQHEVLTPGEVVAPAETVAEAEAIGATEALPEDFVSKAGEEVPVPVETPAESLGVTVGLEVRFDGKAYEVVGIEQQEEWEAEAGEQAIVVRELGKKGAQAETVDISDISTKLPTLKQRTKGDLLRIAKEEGAPVEKGDTKAMVAASIQRNRDMNNKEYFSVETVNRERFSLLDAMANFDVDEAGFKEMTGMWGSTMRFFAKWFMFGEARVRAGSELYQDGLEVFLKLQSSLDVGVARVERALRDAGFKTGRGLEGLADVWNSQENPQEILFALEEKNGRDRLTPEQQKLYDVLKGQIDLNLNLLKDAGVLSKGWLEAHIGRLEDELDKAEKKSKDADALKEEIRVVSELQEVIDNHSNQVEGSKALGNALSDRRRELAKLSRDEEANREDIARINNEIQALQTKFDGYVSHVMVYRAVAEKIKGERDAGARTKTAKELKSFFATRKGTATLREYTQGWVDSKGKEHDAILEAKDLNPLKVTMQMTVDTLSRIEMKNFTEMLVAHGLVVKKGENIARRPDGTEVDIRKTGIKWEDVGNIPGLDKRGMEGMKMHPIAVSMLEELAGADNKAGRTWFDKLLAIVKTGQFMNPSIIWTYNPLQAIMGGINMPKWVINHPQAWREVMSNGLEWEKAVQAGAFQNPGLATQAAQEDTIDIAVQRMQEDVSRSARLVPKVFETEARSYKEVADGIREKEGVVGKGAQVAKELGEALMMPYRGIGKATWLGDNVQRMATFLTLKDANPDLNDAQIGRMTADIHGAYGKTSAAYRRIGGRIFFVHTFRLLMPQRIMKGFTDFPRQLVENTWLNEDQKYTKAEMRRAAQAFAGTVALPIGTYMIMTANGWEPDDEGLPEWWKTMKAKIPVGLPFPTLMNHWKWKKTITTPEGNRREMVTGINNIVNMPTKWIERASKSRPERLDDMNYHIANLFKWEISPFYRTVLDVVSNESSMGGNRPYNPADSIYKNIFDASRYVFGSSLRVYGSLVGSTADNAQKRKVKQELDSGLNAFEKVALGYYAGYTKTGPFVPLQAGYTYTRSERRKRLGFALRALDNSISEEKNYIDRTYKDRPDQKRRLTADINKIHRVRKKRLRDIFLGGQVN